MTKIRNFPATGKNKLDADDYITDMEIGLEMHEMEVEFKKGAFSAVEKFLAEVPLDLGVFTICGERIDDSSNNLFIFLESDKGYRIELTLTPTEEGGNINISLIHERADAFEVYNLETGKWETEEKDWEDTAFEDGEIDEFEEDLLETVQIAGMMDIAETREEKKELFYRIRDNNEAILELSRRLGDLVLFDMITSGKKQRVIGLIPFPEEFEGLVVHYENGKYVIGTEIVDTKGEFYKDVFALESIDEAEKYMKTCLDHYWRDYVYIIPISPNCYAIFDDDNTFKLHTLDGQPPTAAEKQEAKSMRKILARI